MCKVWREMNREGVAVAHCTIERLIRTWDANTANAHNGPRLPELISEQNTGSGAWADTACRSKKNEAFLERGMFKGNIHRGRMPRWPQPEHIARANAKRSAVRSAVEHVFAGQKRRMGLFIRTIGITRARIKIGMANLAYNVQRIAWPRGEVRPHSRKTGHPAAIRPRIPTKPGQNEQPLRAKERDQRLRTGVRPETAGSSRCPVGRLEKPSHLRG